MKADLRQQLLRFSGVGGIGFVVDGGLLWLLLLNGIDPYLARAFSFPVAVLTTWWLNRIWTFSLASRSRPAQQFSRYLVVQITGALSNYVVYAIVLMLLEHNTTNALIALAIGSLIGMLINLSGARRLVFSTNTHPRSST